MAYFKAVSYLKLALSVVLLSASVAAAEAPNVVLIVADDLGHDDLGSTNPRVVSPSAARPASGRT
ncbi:MAG: hypothetical protein AAFY28_21780 [Actinomycetota bacterium]